MQLQAYVQLNGPALLGILLLWVIEEAEMKTNAFTFTNRVICES